jgi:hypothetical protein
VLIHVEIQAQRDATLAQRMRNYHNRIHDIRLASHQPGPAGGRASALAPGSVHEQLAGTTTDFYFGTAKLLDHAGDTKALEASHNPFAWIARSSTHAAGSS